jgi:PTS system glucitol/sorbitol-specific IIA component
MKIIYENTIKDKGEFAEEFLENKMFVLFGDSAPDEIKDFCFWVDVAPINGTISVGQTVKIGGQSYKITAVGSEAPTTLAGLGHCTFNFSGQSEVDLLGTIYVENKPLPELTVGTVIQIIEE